MLRSGFEFFLSNAMDFKMEPVDELRMSEVDQANLYYVPGFAGMYLEFFYNADSLYESQAHRLSCRRSTTLQTAINCV